MTLKLRNLLPLTIITLIWFAGASYAVGATLELARLLSDGAVLQRGEKIPVWGWADAGQAVTVVIGDYTGKTVASAEGKWKLLLPPMKAGGPYEMDVSAGGERLLVKDILIGEVWICSGQSNMQWPVVRASNAEFELATANWPEIRQFEVPNQVSTVPLDRLEEGEWLPATSEHVGAFTAVGYFFGRELFKRLQVPIGLVNTSWGGTIVETWTSPESIKTIQRYQEVVDELQSTDLAAIERKHLEQIQELLGGPVPETDPGMREGEPIWAGTQVDRSDWKQMEVPGLWESRGLDGIDGVIWFSRDFQLTRQQASEGVTIHLGAIDDADITWVNGQKVGSMNTYNEPRAYRVTSDYLREGSNLLVVRVTDTGGGGGIAGDPEQLFVQTKSSRIPLSGTWVFKVGKVRIRSALGPNSKPTLLYNAMVNPLIPYAFRGAIWYQGESNAGEAYEYRDHFPLMIRDWRQKWDKGDFPFLFVQLANFMKPADEPLDSAWAELREAQTMTLSLPNTAQAIIIDLGEADDIHPTNKQDVGYRLSLGARQVAYGENLESSGPMYHSMIVEGNKARIRFRGAGRGIITRSGSGPVKGFALAGSDRKFYWAECRIVGRNEVEVHSDKVPEPIAVRYAWADNPDTANLYNMEGLPACPFRTDDWPGVTQGKRRDFR